MVSKVGVEEDLKLSRGNTSFLPLKFIYCLTFCPSMPGKPIAPCGEGRADEMQRRYVHSMNCGATADRLSHLVAFCPALTAVASRTLESRWMSVTSCHKHRRTSLSAHLNMLFTDNNLKGHEPSRLCSQSSPGIKDQTHRNGGTFLFLCVDKCKANVNHTRGPIGPLPPGKPISPWSPFSP